MNEHADTQMRAQIGVDTQTCSKIHTQEYNTYSVGGKKTFRYKFSPAQKLVLPHTYTNTSTVIT